MRYALYRLTAPILDRIPDISHQPPARQVSIGLAASLLFHFLLLLLALLFGVILPKHSLITFAKPKPKLQEIEVTVLPPVPVAAEIVTLAELEKQKQLLDSTGLAPATKAPDKPLFESDVDMKAASAKPATGDAPLPTQDGRKDRPSPAFTDSKAKLGSAAEPPAPPAAEKLANPALSPPVAPVKKPEGEVAPPTPLKEVTVPSPDEIALSKKETAPPAPPVPKLTMRTSAPVAMLTTPASTPKPASTYQPYEEKTHIEGNISNRGANSVDAEGTPLGRYQKGVRAALGSRWTHYVMNPAGNLNFPPGSVRVSFSIDRRGKISKIKSTGNTSSASYAFTCEKAVRDSALPAPPKGLFDPLPDGKLDITYTFTIYSPF